MRISSMLYCAIISSSVLLVGCRGGSSFLSPHTTEGSQGGFAVSRQALIDAHIAPSITGKERTIIRSVIDLIARKSNVPLERSSWSVIVLDETSGSEHVYANVPALRADLHEFSPVPGTVNLFQDETGVRLAAPSLELSAPAATAATTLPMPPVETTTGPYRRLVTKPGKYESITSTLQLACNGSTMPHGGPDAGFTYLGGYPSTTYTNEVEGGLIFSAQNSWYTPYLRIPGVNSGNIIEMRDDAHHTSGTPPTNWPCTTPQPFSAVFISWGWCPKDNYEARLYNAKCSDGSTPPNTEFAYWNVNCPGGNCETGENILAVSVLTSSYPWHGWPCTAGTCQWQIITSIAQSPTNFNPSPPEIFGPIQYSQTYLDQGLGPGFTSWASSLTEGCQDYKPWISTNQNRECTDGPPTGAQTTYIKETNFGYTGGELNSTVKIVLP
jgi:hypothetical protein